MTLEEAKDRISRYQCRWLRDIPELAGTTILNSDKGWAGKVLEELLGRSYGQRGNDFSDGELKTVNVYRNGMPKENVSILQIGPIIHNLFDPHEYEQSAVYRKIRSTLIVPVYRESSSPKDWMFLNPLHLALDTPEQRDLREHMAVSYKYLREFLTDYLDSGCDLEYTMESGYLEIRNKDSKPYKRIYSLRHKRYVSERGFAFWLKKKLVVELQQRQVWKTPWD